MITIRSIHMQIVIKIIIPRLKESTTCNNGLLRIPSFSRCACICRLGRYCVPFKSKVLRATYYLDTYLSIPNAA